MQPIFPILIFNGRPASGKSEIIQYLKGISYEEKVERFHIGEITVFDDFPILWAWFEEDRILEKELALDRLHTTPDEVFLRQEYWHLLLRRLSLDYQKWMREVKTVNTALIEFSRGSQHGGYRSAYQHLSDTILSQAACFYVHISFEESLRKNQRRFNPDRPDSILEHALDEEKLRQLYLEDDWFEFAGGVSGNLCVMNHCPPFVVFENEDDVTTEAGPELDQRLENALNALWGLWSRRHRAESKL